jgi:hypothetical protein
MCVTYLLIILSKTVEDYYQDVKESGTSSTETLHLIFEPSADVSPAKTLLLSSILSNRNKRLQHYFQLLYTINRTDDLLYNNEIRHLKLVASPTPEGGEEKDTTVNKNEREAKIGIAGSVLVPQIVSNTNVPATNETMTNSTVDTNVTENAAADSSSKTMMSAKIKGMCSKYMHSLSSQVKLLLRPNKSSKTKDSDRLSAMYYNNYNIQTSNNIYRSDGLDSNLEFVSNNNIKGGYRSGNSKAENSLSPIEGPTICLNIGVVGLNNMGNTCFLSSALQCLFRTPIFTAYFLTNQYKGDLNFINSIGILLYSFIFILFSIISYRKIRSAICRICLNTSQGL